MPLTSPARGYGLTAAYGGGLLGAIGALGYGVLVAEAKLARKTIGRPTGQAPVASAMYGRHRPGPALRLVVLGDSSAAGLGCTLPKETPGALLGGGLSRELNRRVRVDVYAVVGAKSADLAGQVERALKRPADVAVVMVGANDVTHRVPERAAADALADAVRTLCQAGVCVVVGTCPDLGTVKPLPQPLRGVARWASRRMAEAQTVAVVEAGAVTVSLGNLLGPVFAAEEDLWSADRFHPSPSGYARVADVLLPSVLEVLGAGQPETEPVADSVQDVAVAASVASRDAGLEVETLEGAQGAAAVGPGRLARLRRRLPLVGHGAPDEGGEVAGSEDVPEPAAGA